MKRSGGTIRARELYGQSDDKLAGCEEGTERRASKTERKDNAETLRTLRFRGETEIYPDESCERRTEARSPTWPQFVSVHNSASAIYQPVG
jgi:hypothetical protein